MLFFLLLMMMQQQGLWYPRQQGVIKAGDGRFLSPYIVGTAQLMQVRDVLKVMNKGVVVPYTIIVIIIIIIIIITTTNTITIIVIKMAVLTQNESPPSPIDGS